jgi:hypothetical protein
MGTSAAATASGQTRMSVKSLSLSLSQYACGLSVPCSLKDTHYRSPKPKALIPLAPSQASTIVGGMLTQWTVVVSKAE